MWVMHCKFLLFRIFLEKYNIWYVQWFIATILSTREDLRCRDLCVDYLCCLRCTVLGLVLTAFSPEGDWCADSHCLLVHESKVLRSYVITHTYACFLAFEHS